MLLMSGWDELPATVCYGCRHFVMCFVLQLCNQFIILLFQRIKGAALRQYYTQNIELKEIEISQCVALILDYQKLIRFRIRTNEIVHTMEHTI